MRADIFESRIVRLHAQRAMPVADHARTRAIPAIHRAHLIDQEQNTVGIAVDQPAHRRVFVFAAGIRHFFGGCFQFILLGDGLLADRTIGIFRIDQAREIRRDRHRQLGAGTRDPLLFIRSEINKLL